MKHATPIATTTDILDGLTSPSERAQADAAKVWPVYAACIRRMADDKPAATDRDTLQDCIIKLGIDIEQVKKDRLLIADFLLFRREADQSDKLAAELALLEVDCNAKLKSLNSEIEKVRETYAAAQSKCRNAAMAGNTCVSLSTQRPELFERPGVLLSA